MTPERPRSAGPPTQGEVGTGNAYRRPVVSQMGKDGWLTLSWAQGVPAARTAPPMDSLIFTDEAAHQPAPPVAVS